MNNSKHTPGPWTADGTRIKAYKDNGYTKIAKIGDTLPSGTDEANARLIAAAPELLEALRGLIELSEDRAGGRFTLREVFGPADGRGCVLGVDVQYEGLNARAAIAKATEQQ